MTGIERLRRLARSYEICSRTKKTVEIDVMCVSQRLSKIADKIEREHEGDLTQYHVPWSKVQDVMLDMERHVLGHEDMEDSPVARWARGLREALGGRDEEVTDVATIRRDAYDAYEWVCEHGGLDAVKRRWECLSYYADPVPRACMDKRLARLQRQIDESHAALRRRNARIGFLVSELNRANHENHEKFMRRAGDYTAFTDEVCKRLAPELRYVEGCSKDVMDAALGALDRRLMPEGMEWPRYESGEPVRIGGEFIGKDGKTYTAKQIQFIGKCFSLYDFCDRKPQFDGFYGELVKRPAPKVLDADGTECHVGDEPVYLVDSDKPYRIDTITEDGSIGLSRPEECCSVYRTRMTHVKPVLAADGKPLREGETVYDKDTGDRFEVDGLSDGYVMCTDIDACESDLEILPSQLTHERPDSLDRLAEDIGAMVVAWRSNRDLFDAQEAAAGCVGENTMGAALDSLASRAKALAERGQ